MSGEESAAQVQGRAARVDALVDGLWFSAESDVKGIVALIDSVDPDFVVVDSVQTMHDSELGTTPGTVNQVRGCAQQLIEATKRRQTATVLVGHVTKENEIAGPRVLEHAVDTVLSFGGDRHHALRLLRAVKHRFGSTDELGLFEMGEQGLIGVPDPSALFLADRRAGVAGSIVVPTLDGNRPLLVEVQALVASAGPGGPRRSAQGVDPGRLAFLVAVLEQRVGVSLAGLDVYVSVVGGVRVTEPGSISASRSHSCRPCRGTRCRPISSLSVKSVSPASSARSRRRHGAWPRRGDSASNSSSCPQSAPTSVEAPVLSRAATLADALDLVGVARRRRGRRLVTTCPSPQLRSRRGASSQPRPGAGPSGCRARHRPS